MFKQYLIFLFTILIASNSFALDKNIEDALAANDWQQVYNLLEKKNKYKKDPVHKFLMYHSCIAIDCDLNVVYPRINEKSFKKLDKWITKFSAKYPNSIISKHFLSELFLIKGDVRKSIQYSIEISKKDSSFIPTYITRSNAFLIQGKFEHALNALNHLLNQDSVNAIAFINRGMLYDELGKYDSALIDYNKSIELNPKNVIVHYNKGNTYRHLNNDSLAIISFSKAIEIDSKYFVAYYNRGNNYFDNEDYENAKKDYKNFLKFAPKEMKDQKIIIKHKLKIIKNGGSSFNEQEIEKIISKAYNAWANKDWEKFTSYIHPLALSRFKEAVLPMYEELFKGKDEKEYVMYYGLILNMEIMYQCTDRKFFEIESKLINSKKNKSEDMTLPKNFIINNIEQLSFELLSVSMYTTYINNYKQDEELGFMLDGAEWKLLLPAPYMRMMMAMIEHFNR